MPNLTVRNIPDDIFAKLKTLSILEKRSMNTEILVVLEKGVSKEIHDFKGSRNSISRETQLNIWKNLSGKWEDSRKTKDIIDDIVASRTFGRDIEL